MTNQIKGKRLITLLPGSLASYRLSLKMIGVIVALSFGVAAILQVIGHPLYAGMTVALGVYLVICTLLFVTIPLIFIDIAFD